MKFYNFFIILLAVIFISSAGITKDTEDTQSEEYSSVAKDVNDSAEEPKSLITMKPMGLHRFSV